MPSNLTRREMLRLGAAGVFALGWGPRQLLGNSAGAPENFAFIAVNDLHFSDQNCRPWFDQVVAEMKRSAPEAEFCLLGGDLADNGTPAQLKNVRDAFARLRIPVYSVIGNHDYLTANNRAPYLQIFPDRINYLFDYRGWQLLGLDTSDGQKSRFTVISDATLHWLDKNLPRLDRARPTIVFTHFPLSGIFFVRPLNADALLDRLRGFNVQAIFSGHYHGYTEHQIRGATLTTDRCCSRIRENHDGTKEKGWFVCQTGKGQVTRRFVEFQPTVS